MLQPDAPRLQCGSRKKPPKSTEKGGFLEKIPENSTRKGGEVWNAEVGKEKEIGGC